jgi:hypothetical protein
MAFIDDETALDPGVPRELYDFELAGITDQFYTDWHTDLSVLGETYVAADISRSDIVVGHGRWIDLKIRVPRNLSIATVLTFSQPPRECLVTVRRYHGTIGNVGIVAKGTITASELVDDATVEFTVPSLVSEAMNSEVPSVIVGPLCNHWLYDARCTVLKTSFQKTTTIATITSDPRIITVTSLDSAADQVYQGGYIQRDTDGEKQLIVDQTGVTLTLQEEFRALSVGNAVTVQQGCDRTISTCNTKFSNKVNHGGFPYAPVENLFKFGTRKSGG